MFPYPRRWLQIVGSCACALLLIACSPAEKYPEAYGVFVWNGKTWVDLPKRIEGSANVSIPELQNDPMFLLHSKNVDSLANQFGIHKVYKFRSMATVTGLRDGSVPPDRVPQKDPSFQVGFSFREDSQPLPGRLLPVKGQPDMIVWKPSSPIPNGVYFPMVGEEFRELLQRGRLPTYLRIQVGVFSFDSKQGFEESCLDKLRVFRGIGDAFPVERYVPCSSNSPSATSANAAAPTTQTKPAPPTATTPLASNSSQTTTAAMPAVSNVVELNPRWYGTWIDKKGGEKLTASSVKFRDCPWAAKEAEIPKRAGCWAHYDGKSQTLSELVGTGRATINSQSATIAQTISSTERYKVVKFTRRDENGEDFVTDCDTVYFYDRERVLNRTWCQNDPGQRVELSVLEKSSK